MLLWRLIIGIIVYYTPPPKKKILILIIKAKGGRLGWLGPATFFYSNGGLAGHLHSVVNAHLGLCRKFQ